MEAWKAREAMGGESCGRRPKGKTSAAGGEACPARLHPNEGEELARGESELWANHSMGRMDTRSGVESIGHRGEGRGRNDVAKTLV